jgi:hypothetical protein
LIPDVEGTQSLNLTDYFDSCRKSSGSEVIAIFMPIKTDEMKVKVVCLFTGQQIYLI